jgi:hypothetical protein
MIEWFENIVKVISVKGRNDIWVWLICSFVPLLLMRNIMALCLLSKCKNIYDYLIVVMCNKFSSLLSNSFWNFFLKKTIIFTTFFWKFYLNVNLNSWIENRLLKDLKWTQDQESVKYLNNVFLITGNAFMHQNCINRRRKRNSNYKI